MCNRIKNLLIIRFSALGDVAMTVPVIDSLARQYPDMHITVLSRQMTKPLFSYMPQNVTFWGIDLKNSYKGIGGLNTLFREIKEKRFDAVADFHNVLRTIYLRTRCVLSGIRVAHINKGKAEKKELVKNGPANKILDSSFVRYQKVLQELGIDVDIDFKACFTGEKGKKWIGIAPFAAHEGKIYPLDKMKQTAQMLAAKGYKVYLFGAGEKEIRILESWEGENIINTAGKLGGMAKEMELMSQLDAMISMDSANMHIASLVGTRVVSVWGATHPNAGFLGWKQSMDDVVQVDMPCRPCSIYGGKPCRLEGSKYNCMRMIEPERIIDKIVNSEYINKD
jgi:ADP-heptose:LPS heptosyltransferase